jgi:hypothetical protein
LSAINLISKNKNISTNIKSSNWYCDLISHKMEIYSISDVSSFLIKFK